MAVAQQEIEQATALAQQGESEAAVALLSQLIQRDASNVAAWLALSDVVDDPERAEYCLQKVLNLDPGNSAALERLSESKGGSLSVGSVGGFNQRASSAGTDKAPAAQSEASQAAEKLEADRPESVPEIPQALSEEPKEDDEFSSAEGLSDNSSRDEADPGGFQESADLLEGEAPAPENMDEAAYADAKEPGVSPDGEAQLSAAAAAPAVADQVPAGRSSIGRTDLILISLTVLAGVVLCALVSAALI